MKVPAWLVREHEQHEDLCTIPCPEKVAVDALYLFQQGYRLPPLLLRVAPNARRTFSECYRLLGNYHLTMRQGFTLGDLAHELAHVLMFEAHPEGHNHGPEFVVCMDEVAEWMGGFTLEALDAAAEGR